MLEFGNSVIRTRTTFLLMRYPDETPEEAYERNCIELKECVLALARALANMEVENLYAEHENTPTSSTDKEDNHQKMNK